MGRAIWKWRSQCACGGLFEKLHAAVLAACCHKNPSLKPNVDAWLRNILSHIQKKIQGKNSIVAKEILNESVYIINVDQDKMLAGPFDVVKALETEKSMLEARLRRKHEIILEYLWQELRCIRHMAAKDKRIRELEDQVDNLRNANLAHNRCPFNEVSKKQQSRHLGSIW